MAKYGIGQPLSRFEGARLLRGQSRFIDDVNLLGQAYAVVLRSPHAHATIRAIDTKSAASAPGVLAVYTGDVARDGLGTMVVALPRKRPDGSPIFARPHRGLARGRVCFVGDPAALVVADTLAAARDAAERVVVDYNPLPSVAPGAPPVWDECPDNISNVFEVGNKAETEAAIAKATHVIKRRYVISRVYAHYMEPRGVIGSYDPPMLLHPIAAQAGRRRST
jgi:carbon-monoxide dehydrogenase large subunit